MDARLLGKLRKQAPSMLAKWLPDAGADSRQGSRALRDLGTGLLPLVLDSLQFEGFSELDHLASRVGETGWSEGITLGAILGSVFGLRLILEEFLSTKSMAAGAGCGQREVDKQIDHFACVCAQAYVQSCARGAAAQSHEQVKQLRGALDALSHAVVIVDGELRVQVHNAQLPEMLACARSIEGRRLDEIADKETVSVLRGLVDTAAANRHRVAQTVYRKEGAVMTSVVPLSGFSPALFLVELDVPAENRVDAARALRQVLVAHGDGPVFGQLMKELRKEQGLSMRSLAEQLGMARGYVSNIENGKAVPSFKAIVKICELLDPEVERGLMAVGIVQRLPSEVREKLAF